MGKLTVAEGADALGHRVCTATAGRCTCASRQAARSPGSQRLAIKGKRRDIGLGGWPLVTLAEAREFAFENRRLARRGGDPLADKRRRVPTFREAARRTFEANRSRWSPKTALNWTQQLERHAFPVLADLRVDQIGREDVLRVLSPIWGVKLDISRKLRGRIRATLGVGAGARLHRAQRRGRGDRRCPAVHADGRDPLPGSALPRRRSGPRGHRRVPSVARGAVRPSVPGADSLSERRGFGAHAGPRSTWRPASGASPRTG